MPKIEIYTKQNCPYCIRAKQLFDEKHAKYKEIFIDQNDSAREEMLLRSRDRRTVPQIFIDDRAVGGCDDLYALASTGRLDTILSVA